MKSERIAPWVFFCIAALVFVIFILLTITITSVMASSYTPQVESKDFSPQAVITNYLPIINSAPAKTAIIVDHNNRDIALIPAIWIQAAKDNVIWSYGSTSHGTQLYSGAEYLSSYVSPPPTTSACKPSSRPTRAIQPTCAWATSASPGTRALT